MLFLLIMFKEMTSLSPVAYDVHGGDFSARAVAQRAKSPGWNRELMMAKEARTPRFLYREAWSNKQFLKTKVGPGTYESTDFIKELARRPGSARGVCASLDSRFREVQSCTPGPGNYGKGGVPGAALEAMSARSAGGVLMKHSSGWKRCSEETKKHAVGAASTERDLEGFCDALNRPERRKHGVFSSVARHPSVPSERIYHSTLAQWPRATGLPGPGYYEVGYPGRPLNHKPPPFFSSSPRRSKQQERPLTGCDSGVGPGGYNLDFKEGKRFRSPTSAFKSSTPRFPSQPLRAKHTQEKLRPGNPPLMY
ncbi:lymphocyte expansion molecule isoform X3 [Gadus morhua]|uniref:lymphocyte expansion molecule isoform X3 n=1 Tax=Gadus morhua TaxID=8049 RepID=UPI0011B7EC8C|nr:lymphocyte expansion molecule isoform X3 [Gadus morhua]